MGSVYYCLGLLLLSVSIKCRKSLTRISTCDYLITSLNVNYYNNNYYMNIKTLVIFLNMVSEQDGGIWTNDFQNMDTQNGKCFQYCLDAKLIETYTDSSDNTGYP